jgi:hypothetical protein
LGPQGQGPPRPPALLLLLLLPHSRARIDNFRGTVSSYA